MFSDDDPASLKGRTVAEMECALNGDRSERSASADGLNRDSSATSDMGVKTESEESVGKSWDSNENNKDVPSSSSESIDDSKFNLDANKLSETMGQLSLISG